MFSKTLFAFACVVSCIPEQIFSSPLACNGLEEQTNKLNHLESTEDGSQKDTPVNHQLDSLPITLEDLENENSNKYNIIMSRKFFYPQRKRDGHGYQWNEFRPFMDTRKRSEKGMLLDAPEFILNPSGGGGANSRRVGGLMKSSG